MVGTLAEGLPAFEFPHFAINYNATTTLFGGILSVYGDSLAFIPLVCILESVAISKAFSKGKTVDATQEMIAVGVSNLLGSMVGSMPVTGSFTRTAVNNASGVQTTFGGVITGAIVLLALQFLTSSFYYIPKATLAAVIISAMIHLFEYEAIFLLWKTKSANMFGFRTFLLVTASVLTGSTAEKGILFPQASETRETTSLDGLWNFALAPISDPLVGFRQLWYRKNLLQSNEETILMPVPSSYNDITQSAEVRDHVGIVWYDRTFFVPTSWQNQRVWLRFSSVNYAAQVWVNGQLSMNHEIGHLPFHAEVTKLLNFGEENRVTIACDNTLLTDTVPQGSIVELETDNGTSYSQSYTFDFFNYAGIHRPVTLYTTPQAYIDDITISTKVEGTTGYVFYNISYVSPENLTLNCHVNLISKEGETVASSVADSDTLTVEDAKFWWPYLMDANPGYLYTLKVLLAADDGRPLDVYRLQVGIRELAWTNTSYTINGKPIYFHGFGRHEDTDIRGKGLDFPTIVKDHNLIKWVGANAYRTSHYPYAEEIMDMADRLGIMIVDECPSVNTEFFSDALLEKHKNSLTELVRRDKNRPSVVAWSLANEPRTQYYDSGVYFGAVAAHVRSLDQTRPLTIAIAQSVLVDRSAEHLDIIGFNRYNAWYANPGQLDMITNSVVEEATAWFEEHNKPVMMLEYGADTLEGLHIHPDFIWSEEYQVELMSKHFKAFDILRQKGFFVGEFIWNFADFKTAQTYTRVGGNKKGIFTRNRQPKASAHHLRRRYFKLAEELYNVSLPNDLYHYTASKYVARDEL